MELVKHIDVLFVENIPRMSLDTRDQARRFIMLIDSLYENRKVLIASMDAPLDELISGTFVDPFGRGKEQPLDQGYKQAKYTRGTFAGEEELFAFDRAVSRLKEMQSTEWLGSELCDILAKSKGL
jgi:protein AFG1